MSDTHTEVVPSRVQRRAQRSTLGRARRLVPGGWNPRLVIGITAGVVVLGVGSLVAFRIARQGTLPNLELHGVPVGSLSEQEVRAAVERVAADLVARRVTVDRAATEVSRAESVESTAADLGYRVDVEATVEALLNRGRQTNPIAALFDHVRASFGAVSAAPVDGFDQVLLDEWVSSTSSSLSVRPREGTVELETTGVSVVVTPVDPVAGTEVAEDELRSAVTSAIRGAGQVNVAAPTRVLSARTTPEDVAAVLAEAQRAVSGPVRLRRGQEIIEFTPERIAPVVATEPVVQGDDVVLRLIGDPSGLEIGRGALRRIETDPVDASFKLSGGSVRVVGGRKGFQLDPASTADQLVAAALSVEREATLTGVRVEPDLTTREAKALEITEQVSEFTTYHSCCEPRVTNIHRMADLLDGTVVLPGESLSLNGVVGVRTEENGFVKAPAISEGEFVEEVGGGISQFATTMFNAIFFGGYDLLEYKAHSYYFDRYPVGREATVSWPSPDLAFRNDSNAGIFIDTSYTDTSVTVTFYGKVAVEVEAVTGEPYNYKDPPVQCEKNANLGKDEVEVVQEGDVGFDVVVERVFTYPGDRTETESFFTHYRAQPRIEERRSCD